MERYKSIYKEEKLSEGLSKKVLETMAYKLLNNGTEPEYIFAPDPVDYIDPKKQEKDQENWIRKVTGVKQFNYKRDIKDLFDIYNPIWIDSM